LEEKRIKDGRHVGLDFYDLLIEEAFTDVCPLRTVHGLLFQGLSRTAIEGRGKSGPSQAA
jgi:hypothetical protein